MKKFIPKTNEELIKKMKEDNFKGTYNIKNNNIIWNISNEVFLEIILYYQTNESYISYSCKIDNKEIYITHEHLEMEELYELLKELNNETNTLVIKKTIFGKTPKLYFGKNAKFIKENLKNNHKYKIFKF